MGGKPTQHTAMVYAYGGKMHYTTLIGIQPDHYRANKGISSKSNLCFQSEGSEFQPGEVTMIKDFVFVMNRDETNPSKPIDVPWRKTNGGCTFKPVPAST